jgi:hypothetical protein
MLQKDKIKNLSVPVKYQVQPFSDDRFKKVRILVMHEGLNLNGSVFNMDGIEDAKESIKNIPILAFVKQQDGTNGGDFAGHESELIITNEGEIKNRYLGRPIGIVPADACDYHYEIHDDKTYVAVTGYIWTDYANEGLDILERDGEKSQSMEIRIDNGSWDDNYECFNISKYRYTGLTLLGDDVRPAMVGAKCSAYSLSETFSADFYDMINELNDTLQNYTEESTEDIFEDTFEDTENTENEEDTENAFENNEDESTEQSTELDNTDNYTQKIDNLEKTITDLNSQIFELNEKLNTTALQYSTLETKFNKLNEEAIELREYKSTIESDKEYTAKLNLIQDYTVALTKEEMSAVIESIKELSLIEIEIQLNKIYTQKNLASLKKNKFSEDKDGVAMDIVKKDNTRSRYAI